MKFRSILVPLLLIASLTGCVEERKYQRAQPDETLNAELKAMYDNQIIYLTSSYWTEEIETQRAEENVRNRQRIIELLATGLIVDPMDLYHAAYVLELTIDENCPDCYLIAHHLARQAADRGVEEAKALSAMSLDMYLIITHQPQKYGTRYYFDDDGNKHLFPYDSTTTDEERAMWNVPGLDSLMSLHESEIGEI